ncbi:acyltransferase [Aeromonas caviae]|uniref:acyltransferase n=1 Tax=Aeromonas caviae TaxID=648 RepID=UPI00191CA298|nr:acyltransferase [Aeromonas caviae]MBL0484820.1 acyltransferase [Aeromonas caviae]MBS4712638.1 acyltransferase [Aeromonas caviae]MDX7826298.1 acyltransferase [Aeromonas caviae]
MKLRIKLANFINVAFFTYHRIKSAILYRLLCDEFGADSVIISPIKLSFHSTRIGERVYIGHHARIEAIRQHQQHYFTPRIEIGDDVSIEQRLHLVCIKQVSIGKGACISFDVMISDVEHEYREINNYIQRQDLIVNPTTIGEGCFIGSGVKINAGTVLGKQCIVGANSVVRGTFPDYCVIVGTPAKIIKRYCFDSNQWRKTDANGHFK